MFRLPDNPTLPEHKNMQANGANGSPDDNSIKAQENEEPNSQFEPNRQQQPQTVPREDNRQVVHVGQSLLATVPSVSPSSAQPVLVYSCGVCSYTSKCMIKIREHRERMHSKVINYLRQNEDQTVKEIDTRDFITKIKANLKERLKIRKVEVEEEDKAGEEKDDEDNDGDDEGVDGEDQFESDAAEQKQTGELSLAQSSQNFANIQVIERRKTVPIRRRGRPCSMPNVGPPFECGLCELKYTSKGSLVYHRKSKHSEEELSVPNKKPRSASSSGQSILKQAKVPVDSPLIVPVNPGNILDNSSGNVEDEEASLNVQNVSIVDGGETKFFDRKTVSVMVQLAHSEKFLQHMLAHSSATQIEHSNVLADVKEEFNKLEPLICELEIEGHGEVAAFWTERKFAIWSQIVAYKTSFGVPKID